MLLVTVLGDPSELLPEELAIDAAARVRWTPERQSAQSFSWM